MRSHDEYYYGIEEPVKKRQICTCGRCGDGIFLGDRVVMVEKPKGAVTWCMACANVRLKMTLADIAEEIGLDVSECDAGELEEE